MRRSRDGVILAASLAMLLGACERGALPDGTSGAAGGRAGAGGGEPGTAGAGSLAGNSGTACGAVALPAARGHMDVLILLDASRSMDEDETNMICTDGCGARSKWAQMTGALDGIVAQNQTSVRWGLKMFADAGAGSCAVNNTVAVPIGDGNAAAIAVAIAGRASGNGGISNGSNTPTRAAINAAIGHLSGLPDDNPKVILLVTDGAPNCAIASNDPLADDSAATIQAIADALTAGFPTFVVGVAPPGAVDDTALDRMAQAGGYGRTASPAYYPASSASDLSAALNVMIVDGVSCLFEIPAPPNDGVSDRQDIVVLLDGKQAPRDTSHLNGWDYTDPSFTQVQLYGAACAALTPASTVSVTYRCPVQ